MNTITLTPSEAAASRSIGLKREALRKFRGKSPAEYQDGGGTHDDRNAVGAIAEYALAKLLGPAFVKDWVETKAYSEEHHKIESDLMGGLHVRATTRQNGGLILHKYDPSNGKFVLAVVSKDGLTVEFPGWIRCHAGKKLEFWRDTGQGFGRRPAYLVPQAELLPLDTLRPENPE